MADVINEKIDWKYFVSTKILILHNFYKMAKLRSFITNSDKLFYPSQNQNQRDRSDQKSFAF